MQSNDVSFIDYRLERFSIVLGSQVSDVGNILHQGLLTRTGASEKVADNYILMVSRLFGLVNTFYCIIQDTRVLCNNKRAHHNLPSFVLYNSVELLSKVPTTNKLEIPKKVRVKLCMENVLYGFENAHGGDFHASVF